MQKIKLNYKQLRLSDEYLYSSKEEQEKQDKKQEKREEQDLIWMNLLNRHLIKKNYP